MKIFQRISKFCAAFLLAATMIFTGVAPVFAEEEAPEYGIEMSPTKVDLGDLKPGDSVKGNFTIKNTGKKPSNYKITVEPYGVDGDDYIATFDKKTKFNDIVDWTTFSSEEGSLEPGESKDITFTVSVPDDVPAGGQYGAIVAENSAEKGESSEGASIDIGRRVALIYYANVAGQTRNTANVEENKIPGILFNPPISATSVIENTGNTHAEAEYVLQVFPLFSDEEVYTNEEDPDKRLILPETRRFNTISWDGAPHLGIFRVKQTITVFGESSTASKIVFLCPIWLLFVVLLVIFCIIFWIVTRIRARKNR